MELNSQSDTQFAFGIVDEYQNQQLGTKLLQLVIPLAHRFGKKPMILWGGVLTDNKKAIRFYEKNNFQVFREKFTEEDGYECFDGILNLTRIQSIMV